MPEHIVVRCYSCQSFQAQQLRKTNDFVCKMCGSKQSVRKIYARSFKAADIRPIVQEYNMKRGEIEEEEAQHKLKQVEHRASENEVYHHDEDHNSNNVPQNKRNDWDQFLEEDTPNNDTRQIETGTELLTALPEYKRPSKLGNNTVQNANKWSAQPKRNNNVVTGVKRKWTASESRDSYESAPKYARHENTERQVSNESPRLISTAHLAQSTGTAAPAMTRVTSAPEQTQQHVIDRIRAVTANRAQSTTATVRQVSNTAPHAQPVSSVTSTPRPMTAVTPSTASQKKKSEWDDFLDDEPADDTCQEQDGGELVFADDEGLATVTDEW